MQDIGVLFLVEHIDRELDVVTCLMQKLETGFAITSQARNYYYDFRHNLAQFNPKLVVFPFFYGADHLQPIQYTTKWPLAHLVNLGWEQILNKLDVGMKTPRDDISRSRVFHICWTREHQDFLAKNGVEPGHLLLTGNPVMKLYDDPYRSYFKSREQLAKLYELDGARKWVLFPESYQFAFFSDEHLELLVAHQNADVNFLRQAKGYCERSLKRLFMWTDELSGNDTLFILRPRPSTTRDQMLNFLHRIVQNPSANLKIVKTETAREWILAADHVMSSHSTTLIEAALAGKPIHRFSPEPYPEAVASEWHGLVPLLSDRKAFLDAIHREVTEPTGVPLAEWARARFLFAGDPLDAIADWIARLHSAGHHAQSPSTSQQEGPDVGGSWDDRGAAYDIFDGKDVASRRSRWQSILMVNGSINELFSAGWRSPETG
jgi:surface carbohydrate biosynthesis protein